MSDDHAITKIAVVNRAVLEKLRDEYGIILNPNAWGGLSDTAVETPFGALRFAVNDLIPEGTIYVIDTAELEKFNEESEAAWNRIKTNK